MQKSDENPKNDGILRTIFEFVRIKKKKKKFDFKNTRKFKTIKHANSCNLFCCYKLL